MEYKLRKEPDQVVEMIDKAVRHACGYTSNVEFSAEDASRSDWDFLVRCVETAISAGATTVNIPDTVGYAQPGEYGELIAYLIEKVPSSDKAIFSVHVHNDLGLAVANSLAALKAGARQAEVTLCGIGERAGNAAIEELAMNLETRKSYYGLETNIKTDQIFPSCRLLSQIIGMPISPYKSIVGANAFAHESGIHQDGVLKNRMTYEIMTPESVGRTGTEMVLGKHSGRAGVAAKLKELGFTKLTEEQIGQVFEAVKRLADKKKSVYAEDVEALVLEEIFRIPDKYGFVSLSVFSGNAEMPPTAAVIITVDGEEQRLADFGVGPVDAVFNTLSKLVGFKPALETYQVNAVTGGTDAQAVVTVKVEHEGHKGVGRGSDADVIAASAKAYLNALNRLARRSDERDKVVI
jgi:2-isopropylmalate synthase